MAVWREGEPVLRSFVVDRLLRYLLLFPVGILSLWAFIGHVFFPERSAAAIGWATSPFQYEVGVANLGIGVAAIYAAFRGFEARVAAGIAVACFLVGAGIGHVGDIIATGNLAPGNAGPILIADFLTPVALAVLLYFASEKFRPKAAATLALEAELETARKAMREYREALSQLGK
jgi:Na+/melibiose symporter-like transporter